MLKLQPSPTFKAKVEIPVPGSAAVPVTFEFKHMTRDALKAIVETGLTGDGLNYEDLCKMIVVGWEGVDAAYGPDALEELFQNYLAAAQTIFHVYGDEMNKARLGN